MAGMGNDLNGPPAELHFTVTVKRKATGKVETYEMVGTPIPAPEQSDVKGGGDVGHA